MAEFGGFFFIQDDFPLRVCVECFIFRTEFAKICQQESIIYLIFRLSNLSKAACKVSLFMDGGYIKNKRNKSCNAIKQFNSIYAKSWKRRSQLKEWY